MFATQFPTLASLFARAWSRDRDFDHRFLPDSVPQFRYALLRAFFFSSSFFLSSFFFSDNKRPTASPVRAGNRGFSRSWTTVNWTGWFAIRLAPLEKRKDNRYSGGNTRGDGSKGSWILLRLAEGSRWRINNWGRREEVILHLLFLTLFTFNRESCLPRAVRGRPSFVQLVNKISRGSGRRVRVWEICSQTERRG